MAKTNNELINENNQIIKDIIDIIKNTTISKTIEINFNGMHDVKKYKTAFVNIPASIEFENITNSNANIIRCNCLNRKALDRRYVLPSESEIQLVNQYFTYWSKTHLGE